jgi:hypothetical protein
MWTRTYMLSLNCGTACQDKTFHHYPVPSYRITLIPRYNKTSGYVSRTKNKTTDTNTEVSQMLELFQENFKSGIIKIP